MRGQKTSSLPLSLLAGSNSGLRCGDEEWVAERKGGRRVVGWRREEDFDRQEVL